MSEIPAMDHLDALYQEYALRSDADAHVICLLIDRLQETEAIAEQCRLGSLKEGVAEDGTA